jgi:hypothetical protein
MWADNNSQLLVLQCRQYLKKKLLFKHIIIGTYSCTNIQIAVFIDRIHILIIYIWVERVKLKYVSEMKKKTEKNNPTLSKCSVVAIEYINIILIHFYFH